MRILSKLTPTTDVVHVGFCVTVLVRNSGKHEVQRFYTTHYYRHNEIISFDVEDDRLHFAAADVISVVPWVHGTMNGTSFSYTFPALNVETKQKSKYAQTEEEYRDELLAAEEEYVYGAD